MLLDQLDQISVQISLTPDILQLLTRPFNQPAYQYAQIKDSLRSWMTSNPLFESLYLEILQNRKVLTTNEGIYNEADFYDQAFMKNLQAADAPRMPWVGLRKLGNESETEVLTLARPVPPTQPTALGLLVLNVRKDVFLNTVMNLHAETADRAIVFDPSGQLLSAPEEGVQTDRILKAVSSGSVYTEMIRIAGAKYMLAAEKMPSNGWTLLQLTPFEAYNGLVAEAIRQALLIFLIVLAVGVGLSYVFASMLYDPWRRLAERLQGFSQRNTAESRDVYTFVNSAIHDLLSVIQKNEPIIRDHQVHDLLHDHMLSEEDAADLFRKSGFISPHFLVLVVSDESIEEQSGGAHRLLYLFSLAEETLRSRFPAAGTILERERFGFILNVDSAEFDDELMARVEDGCREIRRLALGRFQAELSFCISGIRAFGRLNEAYEQVKRTLAYKAFMASDICFADETGGSGRFHYPAAYQKLLLHAILTGDREAAEECVSELFDKYLTNSEYPYPKLLQMIMMMMSHVLSSLITEGYDIELLMDEIDLLQLQRSQNRHELQQSILSQVGRVIGYLEAVRDRSEGYGAIVKRAIAFMNEHYADNLSISDIADAIGISASHLSRSFKSEVGKSPLEYLTELRIGVGKQLLSDKSLPLQQIIGMIGYNDVHTFIRSFKKAVGTTPGEFRKRRMNEI